MRWLIRIVIGLLAVIVLLAAVSFLLPRNVVVSRSIVIDAPARVIWTYVSDLRRFNEWSPWVELDPEGTEFVFEGAETGVGQVMHWSSDHPNVGNGTQEITAIDPDRSVEMRLDFGGMGHADATIILTPAEDTGGGATEVTWGFTTDLGLNPIARWFGLAFDKWVGNDYEKGLENLKRQSEQQAARQG